MTPIQPTSENGSVVWVASLARVAALCGAGLLVGVVLLVVASVVGRAVVGWGPVPGDYELVEMGVALAVFWCLPWTRVQQGHATVDLLWAHLSPQARASILRLSDLLLALLWAVLCWQLALGAYDKYQFAETTFILQWPLWHAYAVACVGAVVGVVVYATCVWRPHLAQAPQAVEPA